MFQLAHVISPLLRVEEREQNLTSGHYNAPTRNINFDSNSLDLTRLPPGTPAVGIFEQAKAGSRRALSSLTREGERVVEPGVGAEDARALLKCELLSATLGEGDAGVGEGTIARRLQKILRGLGQVTAHQLVFRTDEGLRGTGIALASGTAEELSIDAAGFVAFRGDDVEATECDDVRAEANVRAATAMFVAMVIRLRSPAIEMPVASSARRLALMR